MITFMEEDASQKREAQICRTAAKKVINEKASPCGSVNFFYELRYLLAIKVVEKVIGEYVVDALINCLNIMSRSLPDADILAAVAHFSGKLDYFRITVETYYFNFYSAAVT